MAQNEYLKGLAYEDFMLRAFRKSDAGTTRKFQNSQMQNLILAEQGATSVRHLPSASKMLETVKKNCLEAIEKYLSFKLTKEERQVISTARMNIQGAYNSSQISESINEVLTITSRFKNF